MNEWDRLKRRIETHTAASVPWTGCQLWLGELNPQGYGILSTPLLSTNLVHRMVWLLDGRELPKFLTIDHRCCVRCCVNLDHLQLASNVHNIKLMHRRRNEPRPHH